MAKKPITADQALNKAAAYCSKAERCVQDVREKLFVWGLDNREDAEHIIDWLKEESFLDEVRYTKAFIHDKFEYEHWGRTKIARSLGTKSISQTLINEMMQELIQPDAYHSTLSHLLTAKAKDMPRPISLENRARLYRFAAQRGFELELIKAIVEQMD